MRKTIICCLAFSILYGCVQHNDSTTQSEYNKSNTEQIVKPTQNKKQTNWMWIQGENDSESLDYLANMDDSAGNTYIDLDDIIDELYANNKESFPKSELEIHRISDDGKAIVLYRETNYLDYSTFLIYDLSTSKKIYQFNVPNSYYAVVSPDLSRCIYTKNGGFYQYSIQERVTKKLNVLSYKGTDDSALFDHFSPDSKELCIQDGYNNLIIFDLLNNKEIKRISMGQDNIQVKEWLQSDLLVYTNNNSNQTYMLDLKNEQRRLLGKASESPVLTLDSRMIAYLNSSGEVEQRDTQTGLLIKYPDIMHRIGFATVPTQWIQTTTNLMRYQKSISAKKISASSTLSDQAGNSYAARNIMDGDASTAWCEGSKGDGIGEWIKIDFGSMQELKGFELINGLAKSSNAYQANNRVKRMKLEFSNGQTMIVDNDFIRNEFLDNPIHTSFVKITIEAVERGSKYYDTCMSEIRFF
ncbi:discoidin domain-containing protein [Paenibacillus polymyxa]|uniref:Discoidin domain-containing protein n=1 Tax=Paenibacillus polymyxa TaxID=1406 RepID=A0AAE9IDI5_PAEPO|nr:discoidin domain-containing protein [Paenibacillus polymyxa]URJ49808.1 discoidin domain-containing protein [Paenibacillus polymyxa]